MIVLFQKNLRDDEILQEGIPYNLRGYELPEQIILRLKPFVAVVLNRPNDILGENLNIYTTTTTIITTTNNLLTFNLFPLYIS